MNVPAQGSARERLQRRVADLVQKARAAPGDAALWEDLADLLWMGDMREEAVDAWDHGVRTYLSRGQADRALALLSRALHRAPYETRLVNGAVRLGRAHPQLAFPRGTHATEVFTLASGLAAADLLLDMDLTEPAHDILARTAEQARTDEDATAFADVCGRLMSMGSHRVDLLMVQAQRLVAAGTLDEAAEVLAACLEVNPDHQGVRLMLSDVYLALGMDAEAREVMPRRRRRRRVDDDGAG
jgi:predicted Zn-dependent protease